MKIIRTIVIEGATKAQFDKILARVEAEKDRATGWSLVVDAASKTVTATKVEETDAL